MSPRSYSCMTCFLGFGRALVAQAGRRAPDHWPDFKAKFNLVSKDGLPGLAGLGKANGGEA